MRPNLDSASNPCSNLNSASNPCSNSTGPCGDLLDPNGDINYNLQQSHEVPRSPTRPHEAPRAHAPRAHAPQCIIRPCRKSSAKSGPRNHSSGASGNLLLQHAALTSDRIHEPASRHRLGRLARSPYVRRGDTMRGQEQAVVRCVK
jgi:hypothetical protein